MTGMQEIRAVYDWKTFLRHLRPMSADKGVKLQFSFQLKVTDNETVHVRTKSAVSAAVPFSAWYQMLPHPDKPDAAMPHRDDAPPTDIPKKWSDFDDKIVPRLLAFYNHSFHHPCHIPFPDQKEMIQFLTDGPTATNPPEWVHWDTCEASNAEEEAPPAVPTTTVPAPRRKGPQWRPFLKPRVNTNGKTCKCGSRTHSKITHHACPLNPERGPRDQDEDADAEDMAGEEFPYAIGTWVAFEFPEGMFAGTITHVYERENLCQVKFTDGDQADYDADEICYAKQLYEHNFPDEE